MIEIYKYITPRVKERFFEKVDRSSGCWVWNGARQKGLGYGAFKLAGKVVPAHRVMFAIANGRDPQGLVMHTCDNPFCVNKDHLKEGTPKDNAQDCVQKGRRNFWKIRGERNGNSKLSDEAVRKIKDHYKNAEYSGYRLAEMFNVTPQAIYLILSGQRRAEPTVAVDSNNDLW